MTDSPGITLHIPTPKELIEKYRNDAIDPNIVIDVENGTFTYDSDESHIEGRLDNEAIEAVGRILLWTLHMRLRARADIDENDVLLSELKQVEIF